MALNNVTLSGRLTRDSEIRYTQAGKPVASFTLAVARDYKDDQGNRPADFINCTVWGTRAETIANHTRKGDWIDVQGRLESRSYENNDGQMVYVTEVNVNEFHFIETKRETEAPEPEPAPKPQNNRNTRNNNTRTNRR